MTSAHFALHELWGDADKSDALPRARALVAAAETATTGDAASFVLADALQTLVQTRTLPPYVLPGGDPRTRVDIWVADEEHTLAPSRRCVAILHSRLQAGTLFDADARETVWLSSGEARPPHELLALAALDVLLYWPSPRSVEATDFLSAAVRALVHGFLFKYVVRGCTGRDGDEPQCLVQALLPKTAHAVLIFLERTRAFDAQTVRRGAVQPLTLEVLRERLLHQAEVSVEGQDEELVTLALLRQMRGQNTIFIALDAKFSADLIAAQAQRAELRAPQLDVDDAAHTDLITLVAACARKSIASNLMSRLNITHARHEADQMQALLSASDLPADSLVRARAHLVYISAYTSSVEAPRDVGMDDIWHAQREAWRGEHFAALMAASQAATDIMLRRAKAETLFTIARHEWAFMNDAKIDGSSPYSILSHLGVIVADHWPRGADAAPQFDAIMSLAVSTCLEGHVNGLMLWLPHEGVRVRLALTTGAGMSGLMQRCLAPALRPHSRSWADARALQVLLHGTREAVATEPRYRDLRGVAASEFKRYRERLDRQGGLRPCGNADCGKTELHASQFKLCASCKQAAYCSPVCQKAAWKQHRTACKATQAQQAAEQG